MNSPAHTDKSADYLGTFTVAKMLGVSVGTVQALVERGDLQAWKTQGGHRRVSLQSVKAYQQKFEASPVTTAPDAALRVMVVDDDPVFLAVVKETTAKWGLGVECVLLSSAIEALLRIAELHPHVLFTDLSMPGVDGFEFLKRLRATPQYDHTHLVAVTGMSPQDIAAHGGLPPHVTLLQKPLDMRWLHGFVSALAAEKRMQAVAKA
jgi:excisionase family DNA binding protein